MSFAILSWQGAAICAVYFTVGIIDSVCGGGGLIAVPALMALGIPVHCITGTNQCSTVPGCLVSIYKYAKSGNVHFRAGIIAALTAILGGIIGAELNMIISEKYLEIIMIALIPLVALMIFLKKDFGENDFSDCLSKPKLVLCSCLVGFVVGAYQGFYGPGAGMLYVLAFTLLIKLNLVRASGTAKIASLTAALSSSVTYALSGLVIWRIALLGMLFFGLGSYVGSSLAVKNGVKIIRPILLGVIVLLFIKLVFKF